MKVMGVDPGLAATGIGLIEGEKKSIAGYLFTTIRTHAGEPTTRRLAAIFGEVSSILSRETPDLIVVEDVFSSPGHPKSGIMLGKVIGVVLLASYNAGVEVIEIPVREAKRVLTGSGGASKDQLEACVRDHLGRSEPIRPDHASDALALALVGFYRHT